MKKSSSIILGDIENNHNWSWIKEIYERNKDNLSAYAILYRGKKITYKEFFEKTMQYANSLKKLNIKKGDEIPVCMANCPEFVYLLGACSILGAKANIFGPEFDKSYIKEIISNCNCNLIFASDDVYDYIRDCVPLNTSKIIIASLVDSLPNNKDPYENFDDIFYKFENKVDKYKKDDSRVKNIEQFLEYGIGLSTYFRCDESIKLDDEFTITYSSGSTNSARPKGIVHVNRSYVTMGRYHDKDASETRPMKNMTVLAAIPTMSNTNIASNISDTLMQGCTIALEPIYNQHFALSSIMINKANFVVLPRSFIVTAMKQINKENKIKLPYLMALFSSGEPTSPGEEKYINSQLRLANAGVDILPRPISPVPLSIAGGDCEHGGIYFNLFKKYTDMSPKYLIRGETSGVKPFSMVDYEILDENGHYCKQYQLGRFVANSPCTMKEYKNNKEETEKFFIKDAYGKLWGDCSVYAYKDCTDRLHIKGRINNGILPTFQISDCVMLDTKNIMSCETIAIDDAYICHIELQPKSHGKLKKILASTESRLTKQFGKDVSGKIFYRVREFYESYPLTCCGKRNVNELVTEGITEKCVKPYINENNEIILTNYYNYGKQKKLILK